MPKYRLLYFIWLCPTAGYAMADLSDIFQPFVSETVTYNDNLFYQNSQARHATVLPPLSGQASGLTLIKDDVINQATLGGAVNYSLGRQKLSLNLSLSDNRFVNNSFLNNISSNDRAVWQWRLGKPLWGEAGYAYTRAMGGFTNTNFYGLNMLTGNNVFANLYYAWHPRWKAQAGLNWQEYTNSAIQRATLDQKTTTVSAGLYYTSHSNNSAGLLYSFEDGIYPNRQLNGATLVDNKYQQHTINALLTYKFTEKLSFDGKIGYVIRQYPDYSQRNYSSNTFNLALNWTPTAKILVSLAGWRKLGTWQDVTSSYIVTEGFSLSPMWQASPKLALMAKFSRQTLDYAGDQIEVGAPTRQDTLLSGQLSLIYTPAAGAEITLGYLVAKRDTINPPPGGGPLDYLSNSVFSSIVLKF